MSKKSGGFLLGAIIGGAAAATAALLLAPKSGKELREDLANQALDVKKKAKLHSEDSVDMDMDIDSIGERAKEFSAQASQWVDQTFHQAKSTSNEALEQLKRQTKELSEQLKREKVESKTESADTFTINSEPVEKEADIIIDGFTEDDADSEEIHPLEEGYEHPEDIVPPTIPVEEVNATLEKRDPEVKVDPIKPIKPIKPIEPIKPKKTVEAMKQSDGKSILDKKLDKDKVESPEDTKD